MSTSIIPYWKIRATHNAYMAKKLKDSDVKKKVSTKDVKSIAKVAVKSELKKVSELKYRDIYDFTTTYDVTGSCINLTSNIAQGDSDTTRDGDKIYLKTLRLKYFGQYADSWNQIRVIVFKWNKDSTSAITSANLLVSSGDSKAILSPLSWDTKKEYRVYYDCVINVDDAYREVSPVKEVEVKLNYRVDYIAAGTNAMNSLYMCILSDSTAVTHPKCNWYARLEYTDM